MKTYTRMLVLVQTRGRSRVSNTAEVLASRSRR